MNVTCDRKAMETGILTASKAVNAKSPLPILSHLLVRAEEDSLHFSATDLEMVIECQVPAQVVEPGAFTAPARVLTEIITQLPESEVHLDLVGTSQARIRTRSSKFTVNTLSHDEYPRLPSPESTEGLVVSADGFRDMIKSVLFSVAPPEETRAILTGILTQVEGDRAVLVTTDGRRLARIEKNFEAPAVTGSYRSIIPARAMGELMRLLHDNPGTLQILPGKGQVFFKFGNIGLVARLLEEGKFPDCDTIIPRSFARTVHANREQFLGSVRRALIMAQEKDSPRLLRLEIEADRISVRSNTPDLGTADEELSAWLEGDPITIAFNGRYLLDALSNLSSDEIRLFLNEPLTMGMLKPADSDGPLYLIMPVRVKDIASSPV